MILMPMVDAGELSAKNAAPRQHQVRFLHAESVYFGGETRTPFERVVPGSSAAERVRFPVGPAVVASMDSRTHDVVALSRPVSVVKGRLTVAEVAPPPAGSDLVATLERPADGEHLLDAAAPLLVRGESKIHPNLLIDGPEHITAIWYGVASGEASLEIESRSLYAPPLTITLVSRSVTNATVTLKVRPALQVMVELPGKEQPKLHVAVRRSGGTVPMVEASLRPNETHTFPDLGPAPVEVVLDIDGWRIIQRADLTLGDASTSFKLEPIHVTGTVFVGERRAKASVGFRGDEKWTEFETDADGAYEATLWRPQRYIVRVKLADDEQREPFSETARIDLDRTLDFHIPSGKLAVHVIDEETRKGIGEAKVTVMSRWNLPNEGRGSTAAPVPVDAEGIGLLAPSRTGALQFFVTAAGYLPHDPVDINIDASESRTIEIAMKPQGEARTIALALAGGAPAAGAEVQAVDPANGQLRFRGTAATDGRVDIPLSIAGSLLMIRHANAASEIRPWSPPAAPERWTLGAPAEPLTLTVETLEGTPPHYGSPIPLTLWVRGVKLRPAELRFLAWSLPTTDNAGGWTGRNLPREPIRIVAGKAPATGQTSIDVLATTIPYPWPPVAKIRAVN
jgi:hypothetical protein